MLSITFNTTLMLLAHWAFQMKKIFAVSFSGHVQVLSPYIFIQA